MNDLEKQIREAARIEAGLKPDFDWEEEKYYQSDKINIYEAFIQGVNSEVANTLHTKGMYSEEEVKMMFNKLFFGHIYPDHTIHWEQEDLEEWFRNNKKK